MSPTETLLARIRGEFRAVPGLQLTFAQARLLWQLDAATCSVVLQILVDEGFLIGRPDGRFVARHSHAHQGARSQPDHDTNAAECMIRANESK